MIYPDDMTIHCNVCGLEIGKYEDNSLRRYTELDVNGRTEIWINPNRVYEDFLTQSEQFCSRECLRFSMLLDALYNIASHLEPSQ